MDQKKENKSIDIGYVKDREIVEEMQESYIDYAMSVIISRAIPDVRDGLKPVQRRILYAMYEEGLKHNAKFRKSANVIGSVLGRYHPHGDMAVYDAMARMAQDFSFRYPLVEGQGNFGCFTKNTKVRLTDSRSLSFGELIKEQKKGKRHWTYSFNSKEKKIEIAEVKSPRLTRKNASLVEVEIDNGKKIRCTPDHRFMLKNGRYKRAQDLKVKDSLMPFYYRSYDGSIDKNLRGYLQILQPNKRTWDFAHHMADKWNLSHKVCGRSGRVRHHKDFNKTNNNPDNIQRMQWGEHWKLHASLASWRHNNDPEYVKKISAGREHFIQNNRDIISKKISERNRKMWKKESYRKSQIKRLKAMWEDQGYKNFMRKQSSDNLKHLWKDPSFQQLMSNHKSKEMKERWQNPEYRKKMASLMRKTSKTIWQDPSHRDYISCIMKQKMNNPEQKERQRKISKLLWKNSEYRAKYPENHFQAMAKELWKKEGIKEMHREKAKKQWQNPIFRKRFVEGVLRWNRERLQENPDCMKEIAKKAAHSLSKKWKDPAYKKRVICSRILGFASSLLAKERELTPERYNEARTNGSVPRAEKSIEYFGSFEKLTKEAKNYNHKVVSIRFLRKKEDVYDITIEPWHNFLLDAEVFVHNSIDGDSPAAYRYTETRMARIGEEMLANIEKDTVNFIDNYDGTQREPTVLPAPLPNLLLNGTLGIAVGMATSIPPHNLSEVVDAAVHLINNPKAETKDLLNFIQGPDFPTGGQIYDKKEIALAYSQGKGPIVVRGKVDIVESEKNKQRQILITEIPYQVNKATMVEQFANLVLEKKIDGIKDIRDESDREGLRIAIDLKAEAHPKKIVNRLYKFTNLQKTFHLNMLSLVDGIQPKTLGLAEILKYYLAHRKDVIYRRTKFELDRAEERAHILKGLAKALGNIDRCIRIIKNSQNKDDARKNLIKEFKLTEIQTNAILEMRLHQLAKLERKKIEDELAEKEKIIKELAAILKSPKKIEKIVEKELIQAKESFGDERRTKVYSQKLESIAEEDLVPLEETMITLTKGGYIKRINPSAYKIQKRGGKGILGMKTLQEDIVEHFVEAKTHDSLLFFTDSGKVFRIPAYEIPEGSRVARGRSICNFLEISSEEKILSILSLNKEDVELGIKYLTMATERGIVKRTPLDEFKNIRRSGLIAINLRKNDALKRVCKTTGDDHVFLITRKGQSIRFKEKDIRQMGRTASGLIGIRLKKEDKMIGMDVLRKGEDKGHLLAITENGFGKKTLVKEYRVQQRGGSGIKTIKVTPKTGNLSIAKVLSGDEEEAIVISQRGNIIKSKVGLVPKLSRVTQGVRIMRLADKDKVASVICI